MYAENPSVVETLRKTIRRVMESIRQTVAELTKSESWKQNAALQKDLDSLRKMEAALNAAGKNRKNSGDDALHYAFADYSEHQKENWKESKSIVVYENDDQLRNGRFGRWR